MRFLVLIALCLAVAAARHSNNKNLNRLLRALQQQQEEEQGYGNQGYNYNGQYDLDDQEDDEDNLYQQHGQHGHHGQHGQHHGNWHNEDDDENDSEEQDNEWDQEENQHHHQSRHHRQQKINQQQKHQCQPKYHLLQALEQANSHLASKLYKQAKQENDDKNTVISPAAVQIALAAIQHGASGNTKRQIQRVTGAGLNQKQNKQAHTALKQSLQGQDPLQQQQGQNQQAKIKTTTTIIINQRNRAQQRFIRAVQACLNAQVKKCNFQHQAQQCRQQINRYVAQKTNHKLQHAVPQDAVTENTKLVVVNTAQVKAKWGRQFRQQQQTKQGRFYPLGSQQPKHVQVLQSQGQFNYYEDEQLQVVGVPTQQQELTLYVIVPKDKDGLNQVEKAQIENGQQLKELLENADQNQEHINIELPKIQIKHKLDAKQTLHKEGVQDAFDADEADLSGINGQQQHQQQGHKLHINKLIHQATIKIDEHGIKAAQPKHHGQQHNQHHNQDQEQDQDQDQDEDEEDEQEQHYRQQQEGRQELYEEIFGQYQHGGRHHQRHNRHNRHHRNQYHGETHVKANHAFAFALKHNPSNQIVLVGRVVDAAQKPHHQQGHHQGQYSHHGIDQE